MHPDSSHAWIYEKLRLQLYSYHARTENSENSTFTYSLNLSMYYMYLYLLDLVHVLEVVRARTSWSHLLKNTP